MNEDNLAVSKREIVKIDYIKPFSLAYDNGFCIVDFFYGAAVHLAFLLVFVIIMMVPPEDLNGTWRPRLKFICLCKFSLSADSVREAEKKQLARRLLIVFNKPLKFKELSLVNLSASQFSVGTRPRIMEEQLFPRLFLCPFSHH
ncbi:MAG: hypothetical protein ABSB00_03210 [Minisyncoccia bacterium]